MSVSYKVAVQSVGVTLGLLNLLVRASHVLFMGCRMLPCRIFSFFAI
jgi:hypothetical protein